MMNVLIVDDDPRWSDLCSVMIRDVTKRVKVAETYQQAQITLKLPNGIDVVLLDLDLPDSPPSSTLDHIRDILDTGRKVFVVTGQDVNPELREQAKAKGAIDCFYKGDINLADKMLALCT